MIKSIVEAIVDEPFALAAAVARATLRNGHLWKWPDVYQNGHDRPRPRLALPNHHYVAVIAAF